MSLRGVDSSGERLFIGVTERFRPGEADRADEVVRNLKALKMDGLRLEFSWADFETQEGREWYKWLIPRLSGETDVLPCFVFTPPEAGREKRKSSPPKDPKAYADFISKAIEECGDFFTAAELWSEPNNILYWDHRIDPEWKAFSEMVYYAGSFLKSRGKKAVLGAMYPFDPNWLDRVCGYGIMEVIDAVGVSGISGSHEGEDIPSSIISARSILEGHYLTTPIWVTGGGFSAVEMNEFRQMEEFIKAADSPAERVYWGSVHDLGPECRECGQFPDEQRWHLGLKKPDNTPKILYRLLEGGGVPAVRKALQIGKSAGRKNNGPDRPALVIGGAGFIGSNLASRLLGSGRRVIVYDNLSRPGVERNVSWLEERHKDSLEIEIADICDRKALRRALKEASEVFHFAAQVAVTASIKNPLHDFRVNTLGTVTLLEELRLLQSPPPLLFTSTNKVYGALNDIELCRYGERYEPADPFIRMTGISERRALDFHSPYGCSKGAADQYVLDFSRTFNLPAAVFRMSCIYGPNQFGTEDQGWVVHFLLSTLAGEPITIFGDGMQVRDALFIDDLVDAMLLAVECMDCIRGQAFNIGGGPANSVSLLELISMIGEVGGRRPKVLFEKGFRTGDQRYYVSDSGRFKSITGWEPKVGVQEGLRKLKDWVLGSVGDLRVEKSIYGKRGHEIRVD